MRMRPAIFLLISLAGAGLGAGGGAGGCATSFEVKNPFPKNGSAAASQAQLASHAAAKEYPASAPARESLVTAVIDRESRTVRLINPTDQPIYGTRVWVDGRYVAWVNELPPRRVLALAESLFVDADRKTFPLLESTHPKVELQTNGDLYRVLGPAVEPARDDFDGRGLELSFPPRK